MDDVVETRTTAGSELEVTIRNSQGLHARPAAQFVRVASKYPDAELTVTKDSLSVNGKSIIGIIMLEVGPGTRLQLRAQGNGAADLLKDLHDLVESCFGEENPS
jgi:phosphocarrier protein HPr